VRMFGELVGQFTGPALVIGGGPSAPADLYTLRALGFAPRVVISANEHGHRQEVYPVTHSVCLDPRHGEKRVGMDELLRQFGSQPIITPCWFGDARLAEWKLACNTGLTAIAIGVFMAASVVVVGIDFYRMLDKGAGTYFHDPSAKSNSTTKNEANFMRQIRALEAYIGHNPPVRAMSGLLAERWGTYDSTLGVPWSDWRLYPQAVFQRQQPSVILQAHPTLPVQFGMGRVPADARFVVSGNEARSLVTSGRGKMVEAFPPRDQNVLNLPRELVQPGRGYAREVLRTYHQKPLVGVGLAGESIDDSALEE
jgi:hypothetical protein